MRNFPDELLHFGEKALSGGSGAFPTVIEIGKSQPDRMLVRIRCNEACTGGTSVQFKLQASDDNSSYADIGSLSETVTAAQGVLGKEVQIMIPEGFAKKYLRVNAVVTGTFSAGKFDAWVDTYLGI